MTYTVEFIGYDGHSTVYKGFYTHKEAEAFKEQMTSEFVVKEAHVYPEEPEEKQPFPGMCECCGLNPALQDDFICEECFARMAADMERDG